MIEGAAERDLDRHIIRGSGWMAVSYGSRSLLTVAATLVLVRLIEPASFGVVAIAWAAVFVVTELQGGGIWAALVHRREGIREAAVSGFLFSLASSLVLYGAVFAAAPFFANAFNAPELTSVLRVMSLLVVIGGLATVPSALLERALAFRARARCEVASAAAQAVVSVSLAVAGYGVWSLVIGYLAGSAVLTTLLWLISPIHMSLRDASAQVMRQLFRYGRFISAANVVHVVCNTADNVVVGRVLGTGALGYYAVAYRVADIPSTFIGQVLGRVMFPVYAALQTDRDHLWRAYVRSIQRLVLLAAPACVALAVAAEPVVLLVLGEKWEPAVTPLRFLAVYGLVKWVTAPASEVYKGIGRPHLSLFFVVLQAALLIPALVLLVPRFELLGAGLSMVLAVVIAGGSSLVVSIRTLGGGLVEAARAVARPVACAAAVGLSLAAVLPAIESLPAGFAVAALSAVGVAAYVCAVLIFARSIVRPMWSGLRGASAG